MMRLFNSRSISPCIVTVLLVCMVPGGNSATQTLEPGSNGGANVVAHYGVASASGSVSNLGRSKTTIASLSDTTALINVFGYGFTPASGQLAFTDITTSSAINAPVTLNTASSKTTLLPQVTTSTGASTRPGWTELADLNGDHILDLVTSLFGSDSISVQLGNGDGTFGSATTILIAAGFGPGEAHAVSLRGNGIMDLIVASSNTNQIAVLLGNGSGSFEPPTFYTVGSAANAPSSLTSGDFNHDGELDVAVANSVDGTVSIFLGNGTGALTASGTPISVGNNPESIRSGDFNGDGFSDLAVANFKDGTVTTLLNDQNETFTASTISVGSGAGSGPRGLAITGNGSSLLLAVTNFSDGTASVLKSSGNGTFGPQTITNVGHGPIDIRWADFNGDGIQYLAVANSNDNTVSLVIGSAGGSYSVLGPFGAGNNPHSAAVGDLDGDGTPDVAVSNQLSNDTGVFLSGTQISVPYSGLSLRAGDLVDATYTPDGASQYGPSKSASVVVEGQSTMKLTTSGSPSVIDQLVTFTATVSSTGGAIPDGETVAFFDRTTQIGSGNTSGGVATFSTTALSARTHDIKAIYAGDSIFKPVSHTVVQNVVRFTTTTGLVSNLNTSNFGQSLSLTATVASSGGTTPTGEVILKNGSTTIGSKLDSTGAVTFQIGKLSTGLATLTASYVGDMQNGPSTSTALIQTINQAQITLSLTSSPNPSKSGKPVMFTATLMSNGALPTGQIVTFSFNNATLGTATIGGKTAIFSTSALPPGSDQVTATYAGDENHSSGSNTVTQTVN